MKKKFSKGGSARAPQSYRSADRFSVDEMPPDEAKRVKASERSREAKELSKEQDANTHAMQSLSDYSQARPKARMDDPYPKMLLDRMDKAADRANKAGTNAFNVQKGREKYQYKKGGSVKSSASSRADGIAQRGKTRGRVL
jgi:hypothetical protein